MNERRSQTHDPVCEALASLVRYTPTGISLMSTSDDGAWVRYSAVLAMIQAAPPAPSGVKVAEAVKIGSRLKTWIDLNAGDHERSRQILSEDIDRLVSLASPSPAAAQVQEAGDNVELRIMALAHMAAKGDAREQLRMQNSIRRAIEAIQASPVSPEADSTRALHPCWYTGEQES